MKNRWSWTFVLPFLAGCGGGDSGSGETEAARAAAAALPPVIVAERGGFVPEGIEWDAANGRILTGSVTEGSVYQIHPDGRVTTVVSDPDLVSSIGIEVDEPRDRLLVANSDLTALQGGSRGQAQLGVYELGTGERIAMVDLAATLPPSEDRVHFANDVAVGPDGTAYVTDTQANSIYQVDLEYQASLLHRFDGEGLALNGIEVHPNGYLLVAGGEILWKVPLDDPAAATRVALPESVPGQDGLVWTPDGRLVVVSNSANRIVGFRSEDDWATAELAGVGVYATQATTAAVAGDNIYVVHPHFADAEPPSVELVPLP